MAATKPRLISKPDGGAEIWYLGWKLTFAANEDASPEVIEEKAPPAAKPAGEEVQTKGTDLRYDGWIAQFDATQRKPPRLRRAKPPGRVTRTRRYFRFLRR